jgi:hypothetical protein
MQLDKDPTGKDSFFLKKEKEKEKKKKKLNITSSLVINNDI